MSKFMTLLREVFWGPLFFFIFFFHFTRFTATTIYKFLVGFSILGEKMLDSLNEQTDVWMDKSILWMEGLMG